jgi:hypothetical protein
MLALWSAPFAGMLNLLFLPAGPSTARLRGSHHSAHLVWRQLAPCAGCERPQAQAADTDTHQATHGMPNGAKQQTGLALVALV